MKTLSTLEGERDFYFNKLISIEKLLEQPPFPGIPEVQEILNILYSTDGLGEPASETA